MRITNKYMTDSIISSIQLNQSNIARSQEQLATSKRLLRPSDDPNVIGQFLSIKTNLTYMEQYNRNIEDGLGYLNMNDTAMGTMGDVLAKANELAVQAANDTYSISDRAAIAEQIDKLINQVVDLGNSSLGDKYIYAGTKNNAPPFERVGDQIIYSGDTNEIRREVLAGTDYRIDSPGITTAGLPGVFGLATDNGDGTYTVSDGTSPASGDGVFKVLFDLRNRLNSNDLTGLQTSISDLKQETDRLLRYRVQVGARTSHFEALQNMLGDQEVKLTENLNNIEGADMARLSVVYNQQLLSYQASLAAGSKSLEVSLLNFLS
jgi:flagellar hook-associated protein 3 FlgL